jgi:hypothetical protein
MPATTDPKPFNWNDRLHQTIFKGKPAIFSAQDLNRYLEVLRQYTDKLGSGLGALRENWNINIDVQPNFTSIGASESTFQFTYSISKEAVLDPASLYYKGIRFEIPTASGVVKSITIPVNAGTYNVAYCYFVLVATKKTVRFNDLGPVLHVTDPKVFSGITSAGFPYELAAADNVIYGDERVEVVENLGDITLGTDEEVICIMGTLRPRFWWKDAATVESVTSDVATTVVMHNAARMSDYVTLAKFFIPGSTASHKPVYTKAYLNNNGATDLIGNLIEQYIEGQSYQDFRLKTVEGDLSVYITANDAALAAQGVSIADLEADMLQAQGDITTLQSQVATNTANISLKANKAQENWRFVGDSGEPTFNSSWQSTFSGNGRCRFFKDELGNVWLNGSVKKTSAIGFGDVIFTLPVGYRPLNGWYYYIVPMNIGLGYPVSGVISVRDNGEVTYSGDIAGQAADTQFILDPISYRADN